MKKSYLIDRWFVALAEFIHFLPSLQQQQQQQQQQSDLYSASMS